jgi:hypothetical protein
MIKFLGLKFPSKSLNFWIIHGKKVQWKRENLGNKETQIMRLCHPPDGITSPKYKLLFFMTTNFFCKEKNALAFNRDRCCHLVFYLQLIPFHCFRKIQFLWSISTFAKYLVIYLSTNLFNTYVINEKSIQILRLLLSIYVWLFAFHHTINPF